MNIRDIVISESTYAALKANGLSDAQRGVDSRDGWLEVANLCEFDPYSRTPAQEAYMDGYYSHKPGGTK